MTSTPPFEPPYKLRSCRDDGSVAWMEVRADGSTVETSAPVAIVTPAATAASTTRSAPARQAVTVLDVPFAEKDEAKQLGARWDAKRRKWYIPAGINAAPFSRWTGGAE